MKLTDRTAAGSHGAVFGELVAVVAVFGARAHLHFAVTTRLARV